MTAWRRTMAELHRLDLAVYSAVAASPTPSLDAFMRRLSRTADHSKISASVAFCLALAGGPSGRQAALRGLASIAVTSAVTNGLVKPVARRRRPDRLAAEVPEARHVKMPRSHSFSSGHSAAAFAFAAGAGRGASWTAPPLTLLAALVGYSRIHTGVHVPGDVVFGALSGVALAELTNQAIDRV